MTTAKRFLAFILTAMMLAVLSGCSDEADNSRVVAISFPNTTPSWQRNGDSIKKKLEEENFTVDLRFCGSPAEQSTQVAELIETKPGCIVIGALDGAGLSNVLSKAKEYNIPIIAFDRIILNTDAVSYYASYEACISRRH